MAQPTIKIISPTGTADARQFKTVNVVSSPTGINGEMETATQATGPVGNNTYPTVQVAPTGTAGLKTIYVPGYAGPG